MNETRESSTGGANCAAVQSRPPELIVAEIKAYTGNALANLIEAGRRLCELKETVPYGEFGKWVEAAGHSKSSANNLMRLFEAYGNPQGNLFGAEVEDVQTFGKLSYIRRSFPCARRRRSGFPTAGCAKRSTGRRRAREKRGLPWGRRYADRSEQSGAAERDHRPGRAAGRGTGRV